MLFELSSTRTLDGAHFRSAQTTLQIDYEGLHTAGREFGLDVAGKESAGFVVLLQHGVKVRHGESSDE